MGLGQGDRGYAMAALLVGMSIMAVMMSAALPVWTHYVQREKEEELIWRGQQYARAIGLFQRKYANTFPPTVDVLVEQKFLRKKYKDPITGEDFQPIPATGMPAGMVLTPGSPPQGVGGPGAQQSRIVQPAQQPDASAGQQRPQIGPPARMTSIGTTGQVGGLGIQGVVSKSSAKSIKIYNGRQKYNEWAFVNMVTAQRIQGGMPPGQGPVNPGDRPGVTFTPLGGPSSRPDVGQPRQQQPMMPGMRPGGGPPSPFGQPSPFGRPSPFGQPTTQPRPGGQPPSRPPGT